MLRPPPCGAVSAADENVIASGVNGNGPWPGSGQRHNARVKPEDQSPSSPNQASSGQMGTAHHSAAADSAG